MEKLLKGKEVAGAIDGELLKRISPFYDKGIVPTLAIVRVGDNPSDIAYENGAIKKAKKLGLQPEKYTCPGDMSEEDLIRVIEAINEKNDIHGILLLQPLPKHINSDAVRNALVWEKDLDCIADDSLAKLFTGATDFFPPCTAESCLEILKYYGISIKGKKAVVIGRSMVIGKPVAHMLLSENATVTICHTKTKREDLIGYCKDADIIIAAAGKANTLTEAMISSKTVVVDVGINFDDNGKMVGDANFNEISPIVQGITPVPGGVGSVTTSLLMKHLVEAAERQEANR